MLHSASRPALTHWISPGFPPCDMKIWSATHHNVKINVFNVNASMKKQGLNKFAVHFYSFTVLHNSSLKSYSFKRILWVVKSWYIRLLIKKVLESLCVHVDHDAGLDVATPSVQHIHYHVVAVPHQHVPHHKTYQYRSYIGLVSSLIFPATNLNLK